jgi:tetratricopeptide (TPR) repeat protein
MRIAHHDLKRLVLGIFLLALLAPLCSVSRENNDLLFIINLYEHNQYSLARQQITLFERDYTTSEHLITTSLIRANIAFYEHDYAQADSLYENLLDRPVDSSMLTEIYTNRAQIRYEDKKLVNALDYLTLADRVASESGQKYRIALLRGRVYLNLLNPQSARLNFEQALNYKKNDPAATLELMRSYIASEDRAGADALIENILSLDGPLLPISSTINVWLDYLISMEEFYQVVSLENRLDQTGKDISDTTRLRFAQAHYRLGNYSRASALIILCSTSQAYCRYLTGLIELGQGNDAKADSIFAALAKGDFAAGDILPDSNQDLAVSSWLERIKILYKHHPNQALENLSKYLSGYEKAEQDPYVLYTYASLLFQSKRYQEAITALLQVRQLALTPELEHNVRIMLGDIWFNAKVPDNALQSYNSYLNLYPEGKYRAHAMYNIALIQYDLKAYSEAKSQLQQLLRSGAGEEINEKAAYLLAEIDFYQANYSQAVQEYAQIQGKYIRRINLDFRQAQCLYYMENFQAAASFIPKLVVDSTNAFQIYMLEGNIYFNLVQYETALEIYYQALPSAKTDAEMQEVNSYVALTLYRLRRFEEATTLYLHLSQDPESPEAYLLMAAKASYHSRDYAQSMLLFKQFVDQYPRSGNYAFALANIGSIYYNEGDYTLAIPTWLNLLKTYTASESFTEDEQVILSGVFSGLQWGLQQHEDKAALDEIDNMIDDFASEYIKFELQYLLLKVYYGTEQWSDILQLADEMRASFPHKENNEIRRYVAASLTGLNRTIEADSVYQQIFTLEPTPDILSEWADLEVKSGNYAKALAKLDQAVSLDKTGLRFQKLLQLAFEIAPDSVETYWNRWSAEVDSLPDQARFIWMKSNYNRGNWTAARELASDLLLNPDYQIRSQAQLVTGVSLYQSKLYEAAITELYRTVYLYAESPDLVLEAKRYIVKSYAESGQLPEARIVLEEIRADLSADEANAFDTLLQGKQD